jgi:hypothetical protein
MFKGKLSDSALTELRKQFELLETDSPQQRRQRMQQLEQFVFFELTNNVVIEDESAYQAAGAATQGILFDMGLKMQAATMMRRIRSGLEETPQHILAAQSISKFFAWIMTRKAYANTVEQMIGDFREEYADLLEEHGKVTIRMRYLTVLLALNCTYCTIRILIEKALFIDKILQRITK